MLSSLCASGRVLLHTFEACRVHDATNSLSARMRLALAINRPQHTLPRQCSTVATPQDTLQWYKTAWATHGWFGLVIKPLAVTITGITGTVLLANWYNSEGDEDEEERKVAPNLQRTTSRSKGPLTLACFGVGLVAIHLLTRRHLLFSQALVDFPFSGKVWTMLSAPLMHSSMAHVILNSLCILSVGSVSWSCIGGDGVAVVGVGGALVGLFSHRLVALLFPKVAGPRGQLGISGASFAFIGASTLMYKEFPTASLFMPILMMPMWVGTPLLLTLETGFLMRSVLMGKGMLWAHAAHLGGALWGLGYWFMLHPLMNHKMRHIHAMK